MVFTDLPYIKQVIMAIIKYTYYNMSLIIYTIFK